MVSIDAYCEFSGSGEKILLPITEVLLRASIGSLVRSKKLCKRVVLNSVLLLQFLSKAVILEGEMQGAELLKAFAVNILEQVLEATIEDLEKEDECNLDEDKTKATKSKAMRKVAMVRNATDEIASDCYDILAFIQAVAVKAPIVVAILLLFRAYNCAWNWFLCCLVHIISPISPLLSTAPQYHSGITRVLSEVATRLKMRKISALSYRHRAKRTERRGTALPPRHNRSSWRRARLADSPYHRHHHQQSIAS